MKKTTMFLAMCIALTTMVGCKKESANPQHPTHQVAVEVVASGSDAHSIFMEIKITASGADAYISKDVVIPGFPQNPKATVCTIESPEYTEQQIFAATAATFSLSGESGATSTSTGFKISAGTPAVLKLQLSITTIPPGHYRLRLIAYRTFSDVALRSDEKNNMDLTPYENFRTGYYIF